MGKKVIQTTGGDRNKSGQRYSKKPRSKCVYDMVNILFTLRQFTQVFDNIVKSVNSVNVQNFTNIS